LDQRIPRNQSKLNRKLRFNKMFRIRINNKNKIKIKVKNLDKMTNFQMMIS